ncbi:DNA mismatch repair protein MutT [Streptomyces mashuensis]|uniref:DNA mismatch repair protein MutT n=1 Tax=Streptomyces mashuensis TaxID=33904 RepID=A0A919B3R9_9ACTN|nr:NUDIX hydrolase [Streptomyces mashuensis]GHF49368.1 DNA mismatch repair protein MutT [Streptomyces mashuensis]
MTGVPDAGAGAGAAAGAGAGLRRAARVILLDPADRVLLLHGYEPDDPSVTWWFTPGGGLEGDETWEAAARRELAEETGITQVVLGPVLWLRTCSFPFDGRRWDQEERYFLARTAQEPLFTGGGTELERRSLTGLRWWTCAELLATRETVYPTRLAELLRTLLDEGPPAAPVLLETERA